MKANFGWHYPPGVTGNEYAISGAEEEWEEELECESCGKGTLHYCEIYNKTISTICEECKNVNEYDSDWWFCVGDMAYDAMKDGEMI
jgi:hypothetical protein